MKRLYTLAVLVASTLILTAAPLTSEQALARLNSRAIRLAPGVKKLRCIAELPELYVFSSGRGFMIAPADDVAQPLLAYADEGTFDMDANPTMSWWLSTYADQIDAAKGRKAKTITRSERDPIAPLLTTKWDQGTPYNNQCPQVNSRRCVTGCVATAMAQVMNYHQWPKTGTGSSTYGWRTNNLSFNYGATTFDWDAMANVKTAEGAEAVSTLMLACGVSVMMDYGTSSSGAVSSKIGPALVKYFGYDKGVWMPMRDYYPLDQWEGMIYDELAAGRPVLYSGQGSEGGHQFVCDGYSTDGFFHINWGWSGSCDGYFQLSALDPNSTGTDSTVSGFNLSQMAVLGMQPPQSNTKTVYQVCCPGGFTIAEQSAPLGTTASISYTAYNYGANTLPASSVFGDLMTGPDGYSEFIATYTTKSETKNSYGFSLPNRITIPSDLAEGTYNIVPAIKVDGEVSQIKSPLSVNGSVTGTVEDGTMYFSMPDAPDISVDDIALESSLCLNTPFQFCFSVANDGTQEYAGKVTPVLMTMSSANSYTVKAQAPAYAFSVPAGETEEFTYQGSFSSSTTLTTGTYYLGVKGRNGLIGDPVEVTMEDDPTAPTTTGMEDPVAIELAEYYDMRGMRVTRPGHGIYVRNGRLVRL